MSTTSTTSTTTTTMGPVVIPANLELESFGSVAAIPLLDESTAYAGRASPSSLAGITTTPYVASLLEDGDVRRTLEQNGFVAVAADYPLFHHVYDQADYDNAPVFLTTDAAYHAWHLAFDKVLRDTEEETLLPILDRLVTGLVDRARAQRDEYAGTPLEDAANRASALYEAAALVLGLDVGPVSPLAEAEALLVEEHTQYTASPITSFGECNPSESPDNCVVYQLYKPRGHYTRNAELERYFRGMSVLGNSAFFMDADSMRLGLMATRVLLGSDQLVEDWRAIYEPTAFLVGASDDYTPFEAAAVAAAVTPDGLTAPLDFADPAVVREVIDRLQTLRPVLINPEAASLRIMGVRLTLDALIIDQLVDPSVPGRFVASALDVAAAFGSEWAVATLDGLDSTDYPGYDDQLASMRALVSERTEEDWGRTVYDAWLWALEPMWSPHGRAYPDFMQTDAWTAKDHQTGFGSYTELKHDTILYAKQAIAEGGNGEEPPPPPRPWVEPDPVAFERLAAAATLMRDGLASRDLLVDRYDAILGTLVEELEFWARIARDELASRPIDEADRDRLQTVGAWMEAFWFSTSDIDIDLDSGPDEEAALVADILTSPLGALELGTGRIDNLLVLVPDDTGEFQVAMGGTYSFYEFWQDPSDRLTDEQWRAMLADGTAPARPAWTEAFVK
jgi:hypothetical protein